MGDSFGFVVEEGWRGAVSAVARMNVLIMRLFLCERTADPWGMKNKRIA
jgi:hypothetical protein